MQILAGLKSSALHRLKKTWALVTPEIMGLFEELDALMSTEKSFKTYREVLSAVEGPCCPYIGVSMTDLTFIEVRHRP